MNSIWLLIKRHPYGCFITVCLLYVLRREISSRNSLGSEIERVGLLEKEKLNYLEEITKLKSKIEILGKQIEVLEQSLSRKNGEIDKERENVDRLTKEKNNLIVSMRELEANNSAGVETQSLSTRDSYDSDIESVISFSSSMDEEQKLKKLQEKYDKLLKLYRSVIKNNDNMLTMLKSGSRM